MLLVARARRNTRRGTARISTPGAVNGSETEARRLPSGEVCRGLERSVSRGQAPLHGCDGYVSVQEQRIKVSAAMDALELVDKLDDLIHNAKVVPLTRQVRIDREEIYEILDQLRVAIPEEIKRAWSAADTSSSDW
jgi:hypothetical protein